MKLMIDIPKDIYEDIMTHNGENRESAKSAYYFEKVIQNGTPLPSGHDDPSEEITKPFWETNKKNNYGYLADLTKLPTGTTFNVVNGAWRGRITEMGGKKYIVCIDTGLTHCIKGNEELVINDVVLHRRKQ